MSDLKVAIETKKATIAVIGLGYVGLPLAVAFARAGFKVVGFDVSEDRVKKIQGGESYIGDVKGQLLAGLVKHSRLDATTDHRRLKEADVISICVPTPLTLAKQPELKYVKDVAMQVGKNMKPQTLVILESTTYPGATRQVVMPIIEKTSGRSIGGDWHLVYSPERADPGNKVYGLKNTPKLIGGITPKASKLAALLYGCVAKKVEIVSQPEVAEMAKVFENVFRNVNIALVNELALLCERAEVSVWEVIKATATKPFGYMPFYPGLGVGGHCIPIDPYYLDAKAAELDFHTRFIRLAAETNEGMVSHVFNRILRELNRRGKTLNGASVIVLGVAYKPNVADTRESPSLKLIEMLRRAGANVTYNDPHVSYVEELNMTSREVGADAYHDSDCVVLATVHSDYNLEEITGAAQLVFDVRGVTWPLYAGNVIRMGEGR